MVGIFETFSRRKQISMDNVNNLSRCLTTWDLVSLSIGATLGTGVYVIIGQVAATIAGPAVIVSVTIAVVASILSALCYAEFGARVPHTTGSAYTYCYVTLGEFTAFVIGWNLILEYMMGTAANARALSSCFDYMIGQHIRNFTLTHIGTIYIPTVGEIYPDFLSCLLTLVVTGVLAAGVKQSSMFSTIFNVINLSIVAFIIIAGSFLVQRQNWSSYKVTTSSGFFPYGASGVLSGAATCFYAFVGFDIIATTGQENKTPKRSIPLAIMMSLFIVFMCYISISTIITLIVPYTQLGELSPVPNAFAQRGFHVATYVIGVGAICGLTSSLLGSLFPLPRIIYAMAYNGLLFDMFRKVSIRTDIPTKATIYAGVMTSLLALVFNLNDLVEMMSFGALLAYTLVSLCVLILRYQPEQRETTSSAALNTSSFEFQQLINDYSRKEFEELEKYCEEEDEGGVRGTHSGSIENIMSYPTSKSARIVIWASIFLFFSTFLFLAAMIHGIDLILDKNIAIIILTFIFGFLCLFCIAVIVAMPQNTTTLSFNVPCVPIVPILAIFFNIFLMLELSRVTWWRFFIWMIIGLLIYVLYGLRYSHVGVARRQQRARSTRSPQMCISGTNECKMMNSYDLDVIPAHRDSTKKKTSPVSPIFWTSILNYHFFTNENQEEK